MCPDSSKMRAWVTPLAKPWEQRCWQSVGVTMCHAGRSVSYGPMNNWGTSMNYGSGGYNLFHKPGPCKFSHQNRPTRVLEELYLDRLNLDSKWVQAVKGVDSRGCWGAAPRSLTQYWVTASCSCQVVYPGSSSGGNSPGICVGQWELAHPTMCPITSIDVIQQLVSVGVHRPSHVEMWELNHKNDWAPNNWYFQTVVLEKTLESPLDCKVIKPINPKGSQH